MKNSTINIPAPSTWAEDEARLGLDWLFGAGFVSALPELPTLAPDKKSYTLRTLAEATPTNAG